MSINAKDRRAWRALGTLAHNRAFTLREFSEHVKYNARTFVKRLARTGMLDVVDVAPVRYFPTNAAWARIEADMKDTRDSDDN